MKKSSNRGRARIFLILGFAVATAYLGLGITLRLGQTRLMFFPSSVIKVTPTDIDLIYEEVWLSVGQQKLNAWWILSDKPNSKVILYLHGNSSNLGDLQARAQIFHQLDLSVLLIDYRGYGNSSDNFPDEMRVYEDAEAAWKYLIDRRRIRAENIFVYGHSLGGAIAIELAHRYPAMRGVIVESSFTSMKDMIDYRIPWQIFPQDWILTQYFDSITKVKSLQVPILFIHGSSDRIVPSYMSQKLFAASSHPKSLLIIPSAGHDNIARQGDERYRLVILSFINSPERSSVR